MSFRIENFYQHSVMFCFIVIRLYYCRRGEISLGSKISWAWKFKSGLDNTISGNLLIKNQILVHGESQILQVAVTSIASKLLNYLNQEIQLTKLGKLNFCKSWFQYRTVLGVNDPGSIFLSTESQDSFNVSEDGPLEGWSALTLLLS